MDILSPSTPPHGTTGRSPLVTNDGGPATSSQGTIPSSPPPQEPPNEDVGDKAVLDKVIRGLRKHGPKVYRVLRDGLNKDVAKICLDIISEAASGSPWPVKLGIQAALLFANNVQQVYENAAAIAAAKSKLGEVTVHLQRLERLGVPDEHEDEVEELCINLVVAAAAIDKLVNRSKWTCKTCLDAFLCAQCIAKDVSDVREDLRIFLDSMKNIQWAIIADRVVRPSNEAPEVPFHLVGMEGAKSEVLGFLSQDSGKKTRVVGLHGQGGIGKTTLMMVVQAHLKSRTALKMAFVKVGMHPLPLKDVQKNLYSQLSDGSNVKFSSEAQGRGELRKLMQTLKDRGKSICLFLDNVWEVEHLAELLPEDEYLVDALPHGSYLLISSRNANVAAKLADMCFSTPREKEEGYLYFPLRMLSKSDAEDLFLGKASMKEEAMRQQWHWLVNAIVPLCGGLPLALAVYGSFFKREDRRTEDVCKRLQEQLKRGEDPSDADKRVLQVLKTSVDWQDDSLKDAFLDVALTRHQDFEDCMGLSKSEALEALMDKGDLDALVDQSLVMRREGQLEIHDLLFSVAKKMAKEKNKWFVSHIARNDDEMAELLLTHPQVPSTIRFFDENVWTSNNGHESYPLDIFLRDVRYLRMATEDLNYADEEQCKNREKFWLVISQCCRNLRMLVVDGREAQEQLSWISNLRQLRVLQIEGEDVSFAGISKVHRYI